MNRNVLAIEEWSSQAYLDFMRMALDTGLLDGLSVRKRREIRIRVKNDLGIIAANLRHHFDDIVDTQEISDTM